MNITVNDMNLYYEVTGSGDPLIMVHGNGEDHKIFDKAAEVLSKHFTCYLLDSRGHGQSRQVNEYHYENITYYGFSDGGIIGLILASRHPKLLDKMIISGANTRPDAVKKWITTVFKIVNRIHRKPLFELMLTEPHITKKQLQSIETPTLVLAGSKDLVLEEDTRFIAATIPNATLKILEGENHANYIVHKTKVADLILEYCGKKC